MSEEMLRAPHGVSLDVTTICNLRCLHCYAATNVQKHMSFKTAKKVIDRCVVAKIMSFKITGGEPLLNSHLLTIIRYAASKKLPVILNTNGTLLNAKRAKELKDAGVSGLQISLDGPKKIHNELRQANVFDKAVSGIKNSIEAGIPTSVAFTTNKLNFRKIEFVIKKAISLGADYFIAMWFKPFGRGDINQEKLMLTQKQYAQVLKKLLALEKKYAGKIQIDFDKSFCFLVDTKYATKRAGRVCGSVFCRVNIEGDVFPCPYIPVKAGNILTTPLVRIWKHAQIFRELRNVTDSKSLKGKCKNCKKKSICLGGCRGLSYWKYARFDMPDPYCWQEP